MSFRLGNERRRDGYTKAAETLTLNHTGGIVKYLSTNPLRNLSDIFPDYTLRDHYHQNTMSPINISNRSNNLRDTLDWGSMLLRSVDEELNGNVSNTAYQWRPRNCNNYPVAAQYSDAMVETTNYTYAGINYGFVNFGRVISQFGFAIGERLGLEVPGTTAIYTAYINEQDRLYSLTSGAQTFAGKFGVFFANGVIFIVPGCLVRRGILSVAGAAGVTAALYPTSDGLFRTRVENGIETAAITGIIGTGFALAQPVVAATQPLLNNVKYIFRGANPRVQPNLATELNMDLMSRAQAVIQEFELSSTRTNLFPNKSRTLLHSVGKLSPNQERMFPILRKGYKFDPRSMRDINPKDKGVVELIKLMEHRYPGIVKYAEIKVFGPNGNTITDLDIVTNTNVVQVKTGTGQGINRQLGVSQKITNLKVVGFDANKLIGSTERFKYWVMKDAKKQGFTIYNDVEDLL